MSKERPVTSLNVAMLAACAVVIIAGLKAAGDIILPVLFAAFLSVLATPMIGLLLRLRVPRVAAVLVVVLLAAGIMVGGTGLLAGSVTQFTENFPRYQEPLQDQVRQALAWLEAHGVAPPRDVASVMDPNEMFALVRQTLGALLALLSKVVLIILYMAFILLEAVQIEAKLKAAFERQVKVSASIVAGGETVMRYLAIKTMASFFTGLILGLFNVAVGLDFAVLWGVLAFALNFIPSIGSVLASIPPIALALVQLGPGGAVAVATAYIVVNFAIGNVIEPRVLGRRLGLSPLVVVISLFFWGWVWGPAGMLLAVPMTVVVKLLLEISDDTRWLAILMGGVAEARQISQSQSQEGQAT